MIDVKDLDRKIRRLLALADEKFGVRADRLDVAMRKIGRRVPKKVHRQAAFLAQAQQMAGNPNLMLQIDADGVARAYEVVFETLQAEDRADRRKGAILGTLGALSFNLILLFALVLGFLVWRGVL